MNYSMPIVLFLLAGQALAAPPDCRPQLMDVSHNATLAWRDRELDLRQTGERVDLPEAVCGALLGPANAIFPWTVQGSLYLVVGNRPIRFRAIAGDRDSLLCASARGPQLLITGVQSDHTFRWNLQPAPRDGKSSSLKMDSGGGRITKCDISPDNCGGVTVSTSGRMELTKFLDRTVTEITGIGLAEEVWLHSGCAVLDRIANGEVQRCELSAQGQAKCAAVDAKGNPGERPHRGVDGAFLDFEQ